MKKTNLILTTGEFAKLHGVNKRTLHYYDQVGLFSPLHKSENGYRCYTPYQSAAFENILALRELGMSIEALKTYLHKPSNKDFLSISMSKIDEIDLTIKKLTAQKKILKKKNEMLRLCETIQDGMVDMYYYEEESLYLSGATFDTTSFDMAKTDMDEILNHLKAAWEMSSFKLGCGSYIALDKVNAGDFTRYDGLFTQIDNNKKHLYRKPKGNYLRGFCVGDWAKIPRLYQSMLSYADTNKLTLTGFAFEQGLNEFAISDPQDYITQVTICCEQQTG